MALQSQKKITSVNLLLVLALIVVAIVAFLKNFNIDNAVPTNEFAFTDEFDGEPTDLYKIIKEEDVKISSDESQYKEEVRIEIMAEQWDKNITSFHCHRFKKKLYQRSHSTVDSI